METYSHNNSVIKSKDDFVLFLCRDCLDTAIAGCADRVRSAMPTKMYLGDSRPFWQMAGLMDLRDKIAEREGGPADWYETYHKIGYWDLQVEYVLRALAEGDLMAAVQHGKRLPCRPRIIRENTNIKEITS